MSVLVPAQAQAEPQQKQPQPAQVIAYIATNSDVSLYAIKEYEVIRVFNSKVECEYWLGVYSGWNPGDIMWCQEHQPYREGGAWDLAKAYM